MKVRKPLQERLASKITIDPRSECHIWTGSHSSQGRYPTVGTASATPAYVHKLMAGPAPEFPPPDGSHRWEAHHTCRNRSCVNGKHLVWLTHRQHMKVHAEIRRSEKKAQVA
jgi:hypothetical protein